MQLKYVLNVPNFNPFIENVVQERPNFQEKKSMQCIQDKF